jgi:predicted nucleic acid-binding protein
MAVWDTSVASGLHPDGCLFELASETALSAEPILLAAPTVQEIAFGLQRKAGEDRRFGAALSWFTEILDAGVLGVLPLTWEAALLAGRLRARHPAPPASGGGRSKRSSRSRAPKPERRVAWVTDIQIAATAWLAGEPVSTADQTHFKLLGEGIADLYPGAGKLEVLPPPELDGEQASS